MFARSYITKKKVTWRSAALPVVFLLGIALILSIDCIQDVIRGGKFMPGVHPFLETRHVVASLIIIFAALAWQKAQWIGFNRLLGWGCWIAPISYALYIAHQPLFVNAYYLKPIIFRNLHWLKYFLH